MISITAVSAVLVIAAIVLYMSFGRTAVPSTTHGVSAGPVSSPALTSPVPGGTPAPQPASIASVPHGEVVYSNPLTARSYGWPEASGADYSYQYELGGFAMRGPAGGERWVSPLNMPAETAILAQVTTANIGGSLLASGGPACVPADHKSYYSFVVDGAGHFSVHAHPGGGELVLAGFAPSDSIHAGPSATNVVAAACLPARNGGVRLVMAVNGTTVFDRVDPHAAVGPWAAGISICTCAGGGDIRFQDIVEQRVRTGQTS